MALIQPTISVWLTYYSALQENDRLSRDSQLKRDKAQKYLDTAQEDGDESQKLRNEINRYIDKVKVAGCRDICNEMQRKLPRDLRDMVYQHILGISYTHECDVEAVYNSRGPNRTRPYPSDCGISQHPHVCNSKFIGKDTRIELAKTWYQLSIFNLSFGADINQLMTHNI